LACCTQGKKFDPDDYTSHAARLIAANTNVFFDFFFALPFLAESSTSTHTQKVASLAAFHPT
jgi:hypothetical protein